MQSHPTLSRLQFQCVTVCFRHLHELQEPSPLDCLGRSVDAPFMFFRFHQQPCRLLPLDDLKSRRAIYLGDRARRRLDDRLCCANVSRQEMIRLEKHAMSMQAQTATEPLSDIAASADIPRLRQRLDAALNQARAMHQAPTRAFDHKHAMILTHCRGKLPREQHPALAEGVKYFELMVADPTQWPGTRFAGDTAHVVAVSQASAGALPDAGVNAVAFVLGLRARGLSVERAGDAIGINPGSALNETDKRLIGEYRAAIWGVLGDEVLL
jgi:hypothetical protein